jgi:hypothetical protein
MSEKEKPDFTVVDKTTLVDQTPIKESFISTRMKMHHDSIEDAEATYEREARYFKRLVSASTKLKSATGISLCSAFFEIAITGLSLQPGSKADAFIESRGTKTGEKKEGRDVYIEVAALSVSAYGELNMRIKAGQIIRMSNPIVIYEKDHFQPRTTGRGELTIDYVAEIPRTSNVIVGVWCAVYLPHNGIDFKWLLEADIKRLMEYSTPKYQGGTANKLYTANNGQIDPGFLEAKCIKHAMRAYTKLKVSDNIQFEKSIDDIEAEEIENPNGFSDKEEIKPVVVEKEDEEDNGGF